MVGGQWGGFGQDSAGRHQQAHRHRRVARWRGRFSGRRALLSLGVTGAGMAAVVLAVAVGIGQVTSGRACADPLFGSLSATASSGQIATHYVLEGLPNCSYPNPPANQLFVALSPSEYDSAAACGGYLEVTGPGGSVIVQVIDQCPPCASGHIDLSEPAFAKLAPLSAGLINVSYSDLVNPALPGPVTVEVKEGSSQYWLALLFDNTGNPLASVQVQTASGGWLSLSRANYNYWIAPSGAGNGPFTVRLTDTQGHQVTVHGITLSPGAVQSTGTSMYGAGSTTTVAPPTPAATQPATPAPSASSATTSAAPTALATPAKTARHPATGSPAATAGHAKAIAASQPSPPPAPPPTAPPTC